MLFAGEDVVRQEARKVIEDFGHVGNGGHVFNLGHGIDKDTDPESLPRLSTKFIPTAVNSIPAKRFQKHFFS